MKRASNALDFERAAARRDRIVALGQHRVGFPPAASAR